MLLLNLRAPGTATCLPKIDARRERRYDNLVFRLAGRSRSRAVHGIEESPHSIEHGVG